MADDFATGVLKLAGFAARNFGWRPAEFWAATPAELAANLADPAAETDSPISRAEFEKMLAQESESDRNGR